MHRKILIEKAKLDYYTVEYKAGLSSRMNRARLG